MKPIPRLLPLVAVSIGGVLAIKALNGVAALPDLLSAAAAHAESAPKPAQPPRPGPLPPLKPAADPKAASAAVQAKPVAACAVSPAELAREAGLSPGELQTLQNLQTRRGQLDDREKALDTQIQLLAAAETKLDSRLQTMTAVKAQIAALLGQADQQQQSDVDRLTKVYEKMKPADAAAVMATLDDHVRIPVAAKMKDAALAAILSKMPTVEAKKLTESLAQRAASAKASMDAAERAAASPPATAAAAAATSTDPTTPTPAPAKSRRRRLASVVRKTPHAAAVQTLAPIAPPPIAPPAKAVASAPPPAAPAKVTTAPTPAKAG